MHLADDDVLVGIVSVRVICKSSRGDSEELDDVLQLVKRDGKKILSLRRGETGYESFYVESADIDRMTKHGWCACVGCSNYAQLKVPAAEMKKAFVRLGLMPSREEK